MRKGNNGALVQSSSKSDTQTFSLRLEGPLVDMIPNTRTELEAFQQQGPLQKAIGRTMPELSMIACKATASPSP